MPVQMELSRIIISEINDQQIIYLREVEGNRTFPILIGLFEAHSIDRRVKGYPSPRPLTHDLYLFTLIPITTCHCIKPGLHHQLLIT